MVIVSNGMYFLSEMKKLILDVGGESNDPKERPVVALIQSQLHISTKNTLHLIHTIM